MNDAWSIAFAALVPFLCLGMLLWMARLEETLGDGLAEPAEPSPAPALQTTVAVPATASAPAAA